MAEKKVMCSSACAALGVEIVLIKIEELHDFTGHPFKVERDQELFELRQSIEREGILVPLIVRNHPNGKGYEILAGHRRKEAAKWAGIMEVPAVVRNLDDDQSVLVMVDSNLQREKILPSEKVFAYKMRLDAMKHQGKVGNLTSDPVGPKKEIVSVSRLKAEIEGYGTLNIQSVEESGIRSNEQLARMV